MRVLMLHNDYVQTGGEYFSVRSEFESLITRNIQAELLTLSNEDILTEGGQRLLAQETLTSSRASKMVEEAIERLQPDVIHAQNLFPLFGGGVIDIIRRHKLPWVRTLRNYRLRCLAGTCFRDGEICTKCSSSSNGFYGVVHACYRNSFPASVGALAYASREMRSNNSYPPSAYILLSHAMQVYLSDIIGDVPFFVKPNAVGGINGTPVPRAEREPQFVYVGRLTPEKGLENVLRQFAQAPDLSLALIGGGECTAEVRSLIERSENIHHYGELPHPETLRFMRRSLAVLVPSEWAEPFGRVAAEALAVGTPALVANRGGLPEVIDGVSTPELVVPESSLWVDSARRLMRLPFPEYDSIATRGLEHWRDSYTQSVLSDQLVDVYNYAMRDWQSR